MSTKESLDRFKYIKELIETKKEVDKAIAVLQSKRENKCKDSFLSNDINIDLKLRKGYGVWTLLALFDEEFNKSK